MNFPIPASGMLPGQAPDYGIETEESIPEGRLALSEGARVVSADGKHIGNVEQVLTHSDANTITHFVIGKGFVLKEHKLVPAPWLDHVQDKIHLSVDASVFDRLPNYKPD
jgi:hypothetical protein